MVVHEYSHGIKSINQTDICLSLHSYYATTFFSQLFLEFLPPLLPECMRPLGMQDGGIRDSAITASSYYRPRSAPSRGRLHLAVPDSYVGVTGGWCQGPSSQYYQWLQVNFGYVASVGKVATQGKQELDFWVTKYFLAYKRDVNSTFVFYRPNGNAKVIFFCLIQISFLSRKKRNPNVSMRSRTKTCRLLARMLYR